MKSAITTPNPGNIPVNAVDKIEKTYTQHEKQEILSRSLQLKNLLKTNLRLLKINDINTLLLL